MRSAVVFKMQSFETPVRPVLPLPRTRRPFPSVREYRRLDFRARLTREIPDDRNGLPTREMNDLGGVSTPLAECTGNVR
jgi:hypothetical protein